MKTLYEQFTLQFPQSQQAQFKNYLSASNEELVKHLQSSVDDGMQGNTYIWGGAGSGKTHLLQASCEHSRVKNMSAIYICLKDPGEYLPEMLEGMESLDLVCIDDIDRISGNREWEVALFHLYNRCKESNTRIIVASHHSISSLPLSLADLKARFQTMLIFKLSDLSEKQRISVIKQSAFERGFLLPDDVINYLITRYPRDLHSLFSVLDMIDRKTMEAGKKVSPNFVRKMLDAG